MNSITRRNFIERTAAGLAATPWLSRLFGNFTRFSEEKSRVIVIKDEGSVNSEKIIQTDRVQLMVDTGIKSLTGINNIGEAWKSLFPGITQEKKIVIKINCLFPLSSHPEVAYAIANGLQQMIFDTVPYPANNIIIWDRSDWNMIQNGGYTINTGTSDVRVIGTDHSGIDYNSTIYKVGNQNQRISRILTDMSDYLINLCVLKNHSISEATFSMKNHYGTCDYPDSLHGNYCNPYIPALNVLPPIRDKQVIAICDALFCVPYGGPGGYPQYAPKRMIFSRDPVAHDTICLDILNEYRNQNNKISMPRHIATAASDTYQLGTNDRDQIDRINHDITGQTSVMKSRMSPDGFRLYQNMPNPFNGQTTLSYRLDRDGHIKIDILNLQGQFIQTIFNGPQSAGLHQLRWDCTDQKNRPVPGGLYMARIAGRYSQQTIRMQYVK